MNVIDSFSQLIRSKLSFIQKLNVAHRCANLLMDVEGSCYLH